MAAIFVLFLCYSHFLWVLLLVEFFWFAVWGCIYRNIHTEICFEGEKITQGLRRKKYTGYLITDLLNTKTVLVYGVIHYISKSRIITFRFTLIKGVDI